MSGATLKNPAGKAGSSQEVESDSTDRNNIDKFAENVNVPQWMSSRIAKIVAERLQVFPDLGFSEALAELEFEAMTVISAELVAYPHIGKRLDPGLRKAIAKGAIPGLTGIERASLVVTEYDAQRIANVAVIYPLDGFFALKIDALNSLLTGGAK